MTEQQTREEYAEQVRRQSSILYSLLARGKVEEAMSVADTLTREAYSIVQAAKKRQLLGLPEPDPDTDYDPDFHADGTERLPGEPRREKGETVSGTLDLSELKREFGEG